MQVHVNVTVREQTNLPQTIASVFFLLSATGLHWKRPLPFGSLNGFGATGVNTGTPFAIISSCWNLNYEVDKNFKGTVSIVAGVVVVIVIGC